MPNFTLMSPESTSARDVQHRDRLYWRRMLRLHSVPAALTVIILGGALARFLGGSWGLPLDLHPDEWVIVRGAIDMSKRQSFEPPYFFRPDHVEMQLSYLAYMAYAHLFHRSSPQSIYATDPAPFILISRTITACFGVAMIVVANLIGKRFNQTIGILAAFVVAFFPLYVDHSHLATPDVPLSLTLMVVILGCVRYLDCPSWGNLLLASLAVSVSIAIKYPGALGAIMIAITVITSAVRAHAWSRILVHGGAALAAVVGFLFIISPVLFTKSPTVVSAMTGEAGDTHLGADGLGWFGNMGFYAQTFAATAGILLLACFALGVMWSVRLRLIQSVPLWLGAIYWVILSDVPLHWARWGLPMFLTPLLVAPIGAYYSFRYLLDRVTGSWWRWAAVGITALMAANLVVGSAAATATYSSLDTRTVGIGYFAARNIDKTNTVFEGYTPLSPGDPRTIFEAFKNVDGQLMLSPKNRETAKIRYVALSSDMYARFQADPKYVAQQKFYTMLSRQFRLLKTFDPTEHGDASVLEITNIWNDLGFVGKITSGAPVGPTIKLYEIPPGQR